MSVKGIVIEKFAKWYIKNGVAFESMKRIVMAMADTDLTNKQKKAKAVTEVTKLGYDLGEFLLNIGIELALGYLKAQSK
jgi:predicted transcriptional regulator